MIKKLFKYFGIVLVLTLIFSLSNFSPVLAAGITLSPTSGSVGTSVRVTGSSFVNSETVTIEYGDTEVANFTTSGTTFTRSFTVPASVQGDHTITVTGSTSGATTATFEVIPEITLSDENGSAGDSVTITGTGFAASETITIAFDSDYDFATATSGSTGSWSKKITIPSSVSTGDHDITAIDSEDNEAAATFTAVATAKITLNKASGIVGSSITVTGSGFAASESGIKVTFDGNQVGETKSASSSGSWTLTFIVPPTPSGSRVIDASGNSTDDTSIADLNFTVTPSFSLSPISAPPGATITVEGNGFAASERNILVAYDDKDVTAPAQANENGSWTTTFTVPTSSSGSHVITARGQSTSKSSVPSVSFKVGAGISLNKSSGNVGDTITVSGSGFAAGETGITLSLDGNQISSMPITANSSGVWTSSLVIPALTGGEHNVNARGKTTTTVADVAFTVMGKVTPNKTSGSSGESITLTGTGFAANENNISVTFDGVSVAKNITANASGGWTATFKVPSTSFGTHTLQVNGSITPSFSTGNLSFDIAASISCLIDNPDPANPSDAVSIGGSITINGSGFTPGSNIKLFYDGKDVTGGQLTSGNTGNFNKQITISASKSGAHTIKAMDSDNNTAETKISVEAVAPSAPRIISPVDGSRVGFLGKAAAVLEWSKVTDPSGVTYNIQVAADSEFENPVIDRTNISTNKYTLTRSEALNQGEYYWRVQAVDGASNLSQWSEPQLVKAGLMSPWMFVLLIILILAILAVIFFFLIFPKLKKHPAAQPAQAAPEVVIPEIVNAEYRTLEPEETKKKALPWRLALPQAQPAKGTKGLSTEDQARLRVIVDFAKSLPLVEPGANTTWLVELAESGTGSEASTALYEQIVRGEIQIRYEPAWMRHPTYLDLQTLLEGQPIIQDLNDYVESVNRSANEAVGLLQDIYKDINTEITWEILNSEGWPFISGIYTDAFSWFQGKYLREPSERDYTIKPENSSSGASGYGLYGEASLPFAGKLVNATEEKEAVQLRILHLKLRRSYRNNEKARNTVGMITQLEVQRSRLLNAFNQFNRINPA